MYLGLFGSAFLAATIVPHSSEAALIYVLHSGAPPALAVFWATAGNALGSWTCYGLGRLATAEKVEKWLRIPAKKIHAMEPRVRTWGPFLGFFSWFPVIGDVLAIALGFFRAPIPASFAFLALGKFARYAVVAYAYRYGMEFVTVQ